MNDNTVGEYMVPEKKITSQELIQFEQTLQKHLSSPWKYMSIPSIFLVLIGVGFLLAPFILNEIIIGIICWPSAVGLFIFSWFGFRLQNNYEKMESNLKQDLNSKIKEIVEATIQQKRETYGKYSAQYSFILFGKKYPVNITFYTNYNIGDQIRLSVSKYAKVVINVELLKNN